MAQTIIYPYVIEEEPGIIKLLVIFITAFLLVCQNTRTPISNISTPALFYIGNYKMSLYDEVIKSFENWPFLPWHKGTSGMVTQKGHKHTGESAEKATIQDDIGEMPEAWTLCT